jgi:hypothetical protein
MWRTFSLSGAFWCLRKRYALAPGRLGCDRFGFVFTDVPGATPKKPASGWCREFGPGYGWNLRRRQPPSRSCSKNSGTSVLIAFILFNLLVADFARSTWTLLVIESLQSLLQEPRPPFANHAEWAGAHNTSHVGSIEARPRVLVRCRR